MQLTLDAVFNDILDRLKTASTSRQSPMHTPAVATPDADARVMVLRDFDADAMTLRFHTDARSPKTEVIGKGAPVGVLFYDREERVQIRCTGRGRIEQDTELANSAWAESTAFARRCYLGQPPGRESEVPTSGLPSWAEGRKPEEDELLPAREHFAVLLIEIESTDWYFLSNDGHRRAVFQGGEGKWLTP